MGTPQQGVFDEQPDIHVHLEYALFQDTLNPVGDAARAYVG